MQAAIALLTSLMHKGYIRAKLLAAPGCHYSVSKLSHSFVCSVVFGSCGGLESCTARCCCITWLGLHLVHYPFVYYLPTSIKLIPSWLLNILQLSSNCLFVLSWLGLEILQPDLSNLCCSWFLLLQTCTMLC